MPDRPRDRPHLYIEGGGEGEAYTSPRLAISGRPPARDRTVHAGVLERAIRAAVAAGREQLAARDPDVSAGTPGFYLEFELSVAERIAVENLENRPKKIELVAVRQPLPDSRVISATVFVPEPAAEFFLE